MPGLVGASLILAILATLARFATPGPVKTAFLVLSAAAFLGALGDGLARLAAVGEFGQAADVWFTVRFFGMALVPAALLQLAGAYSRYAESPWFRPALALVYSGSLVFELLRVGTGLLTSQVAVRDGMLIVADGPARAVFVAFALATSVAAAFLFVRGSPAAGSQVQQSNARRGAIAALLPFGAAAAHLAVFGTATSPTLDPAILALPISVAVYAGTLLGQEVPTATLGAIRAVFSTLPDGLVVVDRKGLVTFANTAANAMLGHSSPGIEGNAFVHGVETGDLPEDIKKRLRDAYRLVADSKAPRAEVAFENPKPSPRVVQTVIAATEVGGLSRRTGGPLESRERFVFLAMHDETAVRSREVMLSRANEVKDLFISMIGHDLKAPINAITGYSELIALDAQSSPDALAVYRYSQSVLASARQIQLMMENARLFSRLVDPQDILRAREALDLGTLVEREVANLRGAAERRKIRVDFVVDGSAKGVRVVAAAIIRSVFQNLVDNAIKYAPEGSKVTVSLRALPDAVEVEVEDEGPGIPQDQRDAVFHRFTRLEQTRTKTEGLGLGLAISKQVVELHGGTIVVLGRPDGARGARFRVRLPREPSAPEARAASAGEKER